MQSNSSDRTRLTLECAISVQTDARYPFKVWAALERSDQQTIMEGSLLGRMYSEGKALLLPEQMSTNGNWCNKDATCAFIQASNKTLFRFDVPIPNRNHCIDYICFVGYSTQKMLDARYSVDQNAYFFCMHFLY